MENNDKFTVMTEWLDNFAAEMENEDELKEWIYVMTMYLWKGEEIESSNRYIRQAFNNMKNNADRIFKKKNGGIGRPTKLPDDRVYDLRKNGGYSAKEIAAMLNSEGYDTDEKGVNNSKGWKKVTEEKKAEKIAAKDSETGTSASFNF